MEIPNKLYFKSTDYILEIFSIKKPEDEIEYIRTDAFIDKACEWIRKNYHNYADNALGREYLTNDFKNYMKGE